MCLEILKNTVELLFFLFVVHRTKHELNNSKHQPFWTQSKKPMKFDGEYTVLQGQGENVKDPILKAFLYACLHGLRMLANISQCPLCSDKEVPLFYQSPYECSISIM